MKDGKTYPPCEYCGYPLEPDERGNIIIPQSLADCLNSWHNPGDI